jgi:hypothetical protein
VQILLDLAERGLDGSNKEDLGDCRVRECGEDPDERGRKPALAEGSVDTGCLRADT